jgi:hypothetical protein
MLITDFYSVDVGDLVCKNIREDNYAFDTGNTFGLLTIGLAVCTMIIRGCFAKATYQPFRVEWFNDE